MRKTVQLPDQECAFLELVKFDHTALKQFVLSLFDEAYSVDIY